MASKFQTDATSVQALEEALDAADQTLDRLKTMYEQYFLGIQKQAPSFLHNDIERKLWTDRGDVDLIYESLDVYVPRLRAAILDELGNDGNAP